jgi:hypothetical protein
MGKEGRRSRLEFIFDQLEGGMHPADVADMVDIRTADDIESRARAEESLTNVSQAIRDIDGVIDVSRRAVKGCPAKDLVVEMAGKKGGIYKVEVRSSQKGVRSFKREVGRKYGVSGEELTALLVEKRIVVLNGQMPTTQIIESFVSQTGIQIAV